jgi:hypothetical protein
MKRARCAFASLFTATLAAACIEVPTEMRPAPESPLFAKPGSGSGTSSECGGQTQRADSRVQMDWSSSSEYAVRNDAYGPYIGGQHGVHAKVFYYDGNCSRSGDLVFDADANSSATVRKLIFHFPANSIGLPTTGVASGTAFNFSGIMQLGSDVNADGSLTIGKDARIEAKYPGRDISLEHPSLSEIQPGYPIRNGAALGPFRFKTTGIAGCGELEYQQVRYTRTAGQFATLDPAQFSGSFQLGQWDVTIAGAWTVESVADVNGNHLATCWTTKKGVLQPNGAAMNMPFRVTISELF